MTTRARSHAEPSPEHWSIDAGSAEVALLTIPASLGCDRVFEIDVRFAVRSAADAVDAWHALTVELNGAREWSRRIPTSNPGQSDSLDFHCRRLVPEGQALRIRAVAQVDQALRLRLRIDAEQETPS
jgi:hypothetical protein